MKIKLKDIAEALNLSQTTVSRALRSHPAISEETRAAVFAQAEKQGYQVSYTHKGRKLHSKKASLNLLALVSGSASSDSDLQNVSGYQRCRQSLRCAAHHRLCESRMSVADGIEREMCGVRRNHFHSPF